MIYSQLDSGPETGLRVIELCKF